MEHLKIEKKSLNDILELQKNTVNQSNPSEISQLQPVPRTFKQNKKVSPKPAPRQLSYNPQDLSTENLAMEIEAIKPTNQKKAHINR